MTRRTPAPALLLLLLVGPLLLGVPGRPAAATGPGAQPLPGSRVAVVVDRLEPAAPQPTDTLELTGTVLNRAAERFDAVEISLHLGAPVPSRNALAVLRGRFPAQPLASVPVPLAGGVLDPGAAVPFTLSQPAATLLTHGAGVYPLQVTVTGRTSEGLRDLGTADSFLPYIPATGSAGTTGTATRSTTPPAPLDVAWILPLTDRPRLSATGGLVDDDLATSLTNGGSLADTLGAAAVLPAGTVVVDPALLQAVQIMATGPYQVGTGAALTPRPANADARAWLARLTTLAGTGGRLDLAAPTFADADLAALLHGGRFDLASRTLTLGRTGVRQILGRDPSTELAVPAGGRLDRSVAEFEVTSGAGHVLVAPDAVSSTGRLPAGRRGLVPVVPDSALQGLLDDGPTAAPSPRIAEQAVLAELAEAYLTPHPSGPLVLTPGQTWLPTADWATHLATLTSRYGWLRPVGLPEVLSASTDAGRAAGTATSRPGGPDIDAGLVDRVSQVLVDADGFAGALPRGEEITRPVVDTAISALSSDLIADPAGAEVRRASAVAGLDALRGSVRAVASREITLTSRNGRIPVTLENNLPVTVDVTLRLTSLDRSRVQSDTSVTRSIQPGQKVQVEVAVRATSAGTFPIRLALTTPSGVPLSPPEQVLVRSTAAGIVAKGVTVAALAVLLLTVLGRGARGVLRRRRRGGDGPPSSPPDRDGASTHPPVAA